VDSAITLAREVVPAEAGPVVHGRIAAQALNNLAYYLRMDGELGEAEETYRRALNDFSSWIPPSQRVTVLQNLASVLDLQGDSVGALETLREAADFAAEVWPQGHWRTGQRWASLAEGYLRYGRTEESEAPFREALAVYTATLGPAHGWTATTESQLGDVLAALGRPTEAEPYLLRGFGKLRAGPGPDDRATLLAARRLATFYARLGRMEEAERYRALAGTES
jgi:tetratricopeptide (TPR) repeat protein